MNIRKDQVIAKQNPNKGNTSSEDMLRMAKTVRELRIPLLEAKSKKEIKNKRGSGLFFIRLINLNYKYN